MRFLVLGLFVASGVFTTVATADTIVLIGDSQVGGFGPRLSRRLQRAGHDVQVVYRNGWTTARFLERTSVVDLVRGADTVVVCLAGNNRVQDPLIYARTVHAFLAQLYAAQVQKVVWLGPAYSANPALQRRKQRTEQLLVYALSVTCARFLSIWQATRLFPLSADRTHFTARGYSAWALLLFEQLSEILQE